MSREENYQFVISKLKSFLSFQDLEKVLHAFITSPLDYCNSLYSGLPQSSISRLQLVQNATARLLTGAKKYDHVTPILASLHWLPVHFRVQFKNLLFVFKALNNQAPSYLKVLLIPLSTTRHLRSTDSALLYVTFSRLKTKGDRAFSVNFFLSNLISILFVLFSFFFSFFLCYIVKHFG